MGVLAGFAAYSALGAVSTSTALTIAGAAVVGAGVASTELGWFGEQQQSTPTYDYLTDKTSDQQAAQLESPELGSDSSAAKKVKRSDLVVPIVQDNTGVSVGNPTSPFTAVQGTGVNV